MSLMRNLPVILFAIAIPLVSLRAQDAEPKPKREIPKAKVVAQPAVMATPAPRRSVVDRLFGKPTPTPAPVVKEEAPAKPKPRTKRRPAPAEEAPTEDITKPISEAKAEPAVKAEPTAKAVPALKAEPTAPAEPAPKTEEPAKPAKGSKGAKKPAPAKPDVANLDDAAKYKAVKASALEDTEIKALKTKADTTVDEGDAHRASVEYNKALFHKIRTIEPSLTDYVEGVERAMLKRLSAEKGAQ
jgi:hypothetical protein